MEENKDLVKKSESSNEKLHLSDVSCSDLFNNLCKHIESKWETIQLSDNKFLKSEHDCEIVEITIGYMKEYLENHYN